jgi:hypothetical protein
MSVVITAHPSVPQTLPPAVAGTTLVRYEAAGRPAAFPVIDVAHTDSPEAAQALVSEQRTLDPQVRSGRYEVLDVRDQAAPAYRTEGTEDEVTFINCFEVEPGREADAYASWQEFNAYFAEQPGFRSNTLHKRASQDAAFALVNVVSWESIEAWSAAHGERFQAMVARPLPFVSLPTLCRPVPVPAAEAAR